MASKYHSQCVKRFDNSTERARFSAYFPHRISIISLASVRLWTASNSSRRISRMGEKSALSLFHCLTQSDAYFFLPSSSSSISSSFFCSSSNMIFLWVLISVCRGHPINRLEWRNKKIARISHSYRERRIEKMRQSFSKWNIDAITDAGFFYLSIFLFRLSNQIWTMYMKALRCFYYTLQTIMIIILSICRPPSNWIP